MSLSMSNQGSLSSHDSVTIAKVVAHDSFAKQPANLGAAKPEAEAAPRRFKILVKFIQAVKRFEQAINPRHTFGRPEQEETQPCMPAPGVLAALAAKGSSSERRASLGSKGVSGERRATSTTKPGTGRSLSGNRSASGRPLGVCTSRGCKAKLLFKPLPELQAQEV